MSLDTFLSALFNDGRVRVGLPGPIEPDELHAADAQLIAREADVRLEFPGESPQFHPAAAQWGATQFYRAAQFVVYRDLDAGIMAQALAPACPDAHFPAAHYSVDLTFRFLPDLIRLAQTASGQDPLLAHLRRWGCEWPLSSVGIQEIEPQSLDPIANHTGLLALYVDRVLARGDASRLVDPRVRAAATCAVGAYPELAGQLANEFVPVESLV